MNDLHKNKENGSGVKNLQPKKQKTGRGIAILALLLSVVTLVGGLVTNGKYDYLQEKLRLTSSRPVAGDDTSASSQKNTLEKTPENIPDTPENISENTTGKTPDNGVYGQQQLNHIQSDYEELIHIIKQQQQDIIYLNRSFSELVKDRYQWLLNETEYGLGIVILQLINTGNVETAVHSLNYIQERLKSFDYPELLPLRKSIAQDIENLTSVQVVDMSDALVKLDVLSSKIDGLSLIVDSMVKNTNENTEEIKKSINEPYYKTVWNSFIGTIKSGIRVKELSSPDPMLISPAQSFFIKENLKLGLLNVRLALLQRRQGSYFQYLNQIKGTIKGYFDLESEGVEDFLNSIEELAAFNIVAPGVELMKNSIAIVKSLQSNQIMAPINSDSMVIKVPSPSSGSSEMDSDKKVTNTGRKENVGDAQKEKGDKISGNSSDSHSDDKQPTENSVEPVKVTE